MVKIFLPEQVYFTKSFVYIGQLKSASEFDRLLNCCVIHVCNNGK